MHEGETKPYPKNSCHKNFIPVSKSTHKLIIFYVLTKKNKYPSGVDSGGARK